MEVGNPPGGEGRGDTPGDDLDPSPSSYAQNKKSLFRDAENEELRYWSPEEEEILEQMEGR